MASGVTRSAATWTMVAADETLLKLAEEELAAAAMAAD
jgi:hypothetical protein